MYLLDFDVNKFVDKLIVHLQEQKVVDHGTVSWKIMEHIQGVTGTTEHIRIKVNINKSYITFIYSAKIFGLTKFPYELYSWLVSKDLNIDFSSLNEFTSKYLMNIQSAKYRDLISIYCPGYIKFTCVDTKTGVKKNEKYEGDDHQIFSLIEAIITYGAKKILFKEKVYEMLFECWKILNHKEYYGA